MKHILYKTTCSVTGKYYIGMHTTHNEDDGYLGSGKILKRSVKAHGASTHIRETIAEFDTREELAAAEFTIISEHLGQPNCMNLVDGGIGGNKIAWTEERRAKAAKHFKSMIRNHEHTTKIANALKGKPLSAERREKISAKLKNREPSEAEIRARLNRRGQEHMPKFNWAVKSPNGDVHEISNLNKWCQQNGFKYATLYKSLLKPITRGTAKGWQLIIKTPNSQTTE